MVASNTKSWNYIQITFKLSNSKDYFILILLLMNRTKTAKQNCWRLKGLSPSKSSPYKTINGDVGKTLWWGLIIRDLQSKICGILSKSNQNELMPINALKDMVLFVFPSM